MVYSIGGPYHKLIAAVIYGFRDKLDCLSQNTRLGWKGLPGTNTLTKFNRTDHISHLCRKATVLSCQRCLINPGVEIINNNEICSRI